MKEELQSKLLEILTAIQTGTGKVVDAAGKAGDFAMEQLPDIVQSYVAFQTAWWTFSAVLWTTIFGGFMWLLIKKVIYNDTWVETGHYNKGDWPIERSIAMFFTAFAAIGTFIAAVNCIRDALFIWIAPKVWLIQELAKLIKDMK